MGHTRTPTKWKDVPYSNPDAGQEYGLAGMRMKKEAGTYLQEALDSRMKIQKENADSQSKANTGGLLDSMFRGEVIDPVGLYDATALAEGRNDYNNQQYDRGQDTLANSRADERLGLSRERGIRASNRVTEAQIRRDAKAVTNKGMDDLIFGFDMPFEDEIDPVDTIESQKQIMFDAINPTSPYETEASRSLISGETLKPYQPPYTYPGTDTGRK